MSHSHQETQELDSTLILPRKSEGKPICIKGMVNSQESIWLYPAGMRPLTSSMILTDRERPGANDSPTLRDRTLSLITERTVMHIKAARKQTHTQVTRSSCTFSCQKTSTGKTYSAKSIHWHRLICTTMLAFSLSLLICIVMHLSSITTVSASALPVSPTRPCPPHVSNCCGLECIRLRELGMSEL